jgi:hypothetical protein
MPPREANRALLVFFGLVARPAAMLERPELRIGPWQRTLAGDASAAPRPWRRPLLPIDEETSLGAVRFAAEWPPRRRLWRPRPALEVVETPDHALLFTLRRSWLFPSTWSLYDAEGSFVGQMLAEALLDPHGQRFAVQRFEAPATWVLAETTGREYARLERHGALERLLFTDSRLTNPFLRMLVLGSFLLLHPHPPLPENELPA